MRFSLCNYIACVKANCHIFLFSQELIILSSSLKFRVTASQMVWSPGLSDSPPFSPLPLLPRPRLGLLTRRRHTAPSGPLHMLFPLPGTFSSQIAHGLVFRSLLGPSLMRPSSTALDKVASFSVPYSALFFSLSNISHIHVFVVYPLEYTRHGNKDFVWLTLNPQVLEQCRDIGTQKYFLNHQYFLN